MSKPYRIVFVINEMSRGGSTKQQIRENLYKLVENFQKESGHKTAVLFSRNREHIGKSLSTMQNQGFNVFVTYGGDGTINDTIQNLNEGSFLIPIPAGNANDMAARLQLRNTRDTILAFTDTLAILDDLINRRINIIGLDVGEIFFTDSAGKSLKKRFINNLGIGVTADTVKRIDGMVKKNYALAGLATILGANPFPAHYSTLMMDQEVHLDCLGIEALLCRKVGNYAYMAPYKRENNETLHFFVVNNMSFWHRLLFVILIKFGTPGTLFGMGDYFHDRKESFRDQNLSMAVEGISSVNLRFERKHSMHVDGNIVPAFEEIVQEKCSIRILPKFIKTIAPC